jgi:hypothetical protein
MRLTTENIEQIRTKIDAIAPTCSFCHHKKFILVDKVMELREFNDGNLILGGANSTILPVIVMSCENCGELRLLSAVKLGIIDNAEKKINE